MKSIYISVRQRSVLFNEISTVNLPKATLRDKSFPESNQGYSDCSNEVGCFVVSNIHSM